MEKPESPRTRITRRTVLKSAAALYGATLLGCDRSEGAAPVSPQGRSAGDSGSGRSRIAIIGGGAGGIAAAYFLSKDYDVDVFEARPKIGGHCDSQVVDYKGTQIKVDLGAQFFHPDTHPIYVTLLEELGLYNPEDGDADETLEAPGSICFLPKTGIWPVFSSTHPYLNPLIAVDFAIYSQQARNAVLGNQSWEMTLEEWVGTLSVSQRFKDTLLYPWLSAAIGTTLETAKRTSARSILQTFALAFPANIFKGASTFNSKLGLEGNLKRMLDRSPGAQVHLDSAVKGLAYDNGNWSVQTASGAQGPYKAVVMNAPPRVSKALLKPLPWAADIHPVLDKFEYFDSRVLIHTDPKYVHRDRNLWAVYNGLIDGNTCEGSVWYGGIHQKLPSGGTVDVFKSWAQRRYADPVNILYERRFLHPLITPEAIRASRTIRSFQGRNGLYFSGQHTTGMDLQEAAVYSAMKVADSLAPESPSLLALRARMDKRGRAKANYDL
ncbi:MAG: hypothetical protein JWP91_863 [Fibrobacteres bacterium]|nr:hypothetical protein [Fibrobacterota bacterium]